LAKRKLARTMAFDDDNQVINFNRYVEQRRNIRLIPKTLNQEQYIELLEDQDRLVVFATGPAGTGKTMLAMLAGIKAFKQGQVSKIVLTRPAVGVDDEKHGFLPGDINQKMEPWTRPLFDVMHEHWSPKETARMLEEQILEISPLAFMRGRTFKNSWIVADEMQLSTANQMKMLLTRIGEGSKMVLTGDMDQVDRNCQSGLRDFLDRLSVSMTKSISTIHFDNSDIRRHPVVAEVLDIYNKKS
jgi:phosphate starvation-inducible protein PhoH and related proteins